MVPQPILLGYVLLTWVIALLNAGFPEEFFYRILLQTRLERLLGRWNALAVASLLFGLMHLPSRFVFYWLGATRQPVIDFVLALAGVVSFQGMFGFLLGYLWMRYRNAWMNVLLHTAFDSLPITALAVMAVITVR